MRMNPIARSAVTLAGSLALATLGLAGCGKTPATPAASGGVQAAVAGASGVEHASATTPADVSELAGRTGELTDPDNLTMVFLYYDLAGIAPPIDQWVEEDNRVNYARGADKAALRKTVRSEFDAGLAAVHGVGVIHLTANADLSPYDPTYGEFTVGALSPGAAYTFKAQGQTVSLKFDNGLAAQSWSVPKEQAQAITDKIGNDTLTLDATLKIRKTFPGSRGGTIVAHVVSWNLRDAGNGATLARAQVPAR
jgi:hypothetical protein